MAASDKREISSRPRLRQLSTLLRKHPWIIALLYRVWRVFQTRYTIGVVGVLADASGHILLVEHVFHPLHPWGLPGGWVNRREDPATALQRELTEELGLQTEIESLLLAEFHHGLHLDLAYSCRIIGSISSLSSELLAYGWFPPDDLPPLHVFHQRAITHYVASSTLTVNDENDHDDYTQR